MTDDDKLTSEQLDAWPAMTPPADFVGRVMAARERELADDAPPAPVRRRSRTLLVGFGAAVGAAAIALLVATRGAGSQASNGTLAVDARTTAQLGERATVVAEPTADLNWHISASGDADVTQTTGDVFYRVERGGAFVVHTPAGDVTVTGTCFRIEVPVTKTQQLLASGALGAALATAVVVTVYEGRVVAETRGNKAEIVAGSRAQITRDGVVVASSDAPSATGSASLTARAKDDELIHLRTKVAALETELAEHKGSAAPTGRVRKGHHEDEPDDGHLWHDPSPERLQEFAKQCRIRYDDPSIDHWGPQSQADVNERGVAPSELGAYNDAMSDLAKQWKELVKALYIEATNDTAGAETLSIEAMKNEIMEKAAPEEMQQILQKISRERAGLQPAPASMAGLSPLERLVRGMSALGDQAEAGLAKRVGASRAHEIRGEQWNGSHEHSGCPKT